MTTCSYSISGGDYDRAGSASRSLKELLKSVGVEPHAVRRVMVAAYEAEMNVIIHAHRGTLRATVDGSEVHVDIIDEGPGIADISLAMKEGWSTAPPKARELGFGAGLGLPNIKKHSDVFTIDSQVGRGTQVRFSVKFETLRASDRTFNSLHLHGELCRQCMQCIHVCPTQALRIHRGVPNVLTHLCVECTSCIETCPAGALGMEGPETLPEIAPGTALVLPPAFLFQFGGGVGPDQVLAALTDLGFESVHLFDAWERAHRQAVREYASDRDRAGPVLSSCCPAVLNLIEIKFPSLLEDVAPFVTPEHAAMKDLAGQPVLMMVCPSQRTSLLTAGMPEHAMLNPHVLQQALVERLSTGINRASEPRSPQSPPPNDPGALRVEGIRAVLQTLEELENGHLADLRVLELYACSHGCFGSGLLKGRNAALAAHRWLHTPRKGPTPARAWPRGGPLEPRAGIRLDADMAEAMAKLARIQQLVTALPGRDCGQCGAPTCRAFAEDVILDRISRRACMHASWSKGKTT